MVQCWQIVNTNGCFYEDDGQGLLCLEDHGYRGGIEHSTFWMGKVVDYLKCHKKKKPLEHLLLSAYRILSWF